MLTHNHCGTIYTDIGYKIHNTCEIKALYLFFRKPVDNTDKYLQCYPVYVYDKTLSVRNIRKMHLCIRM